jgi:hypothetical protein
MDKATQVIKQNWNENPLAVVMVGSMAMYSTAALVNAVTRAANSRVLRKTISSRTLVVKF